MTFYIAVQADNSTFKSIQNDATVLIYFGILFLKCKHKALVVLIISFCKAEGSAYPTYPTNIYFFKLSWGF